VAVRRLRVAFLGNDPWSVPPLEALAASKHRPELVLTRVPKPAGRGSKLTPTAVAGAARRLDLPLVETATVKRDAGFDALVDARPDVLVVVAYGEILPDVVLDLPSVAPVNLHFSLLPALRGASPVQGALLHGLERTGVTTMVMDTGLDTGPVLLQREEPVLDDDEAGSLGERLALIGGELLVETLDGLAAGTLEAHPQEGEPTFAPKLKPEDRWIDWTEPAVAVVRRVRAMSPEPGASTRFRGEVLKVFRALPVDGPNGEPGSVVAVDRDGVAVAAGSGAVRLDEIAPAGRRRMAAADFARGHRPEIGERLGDGGETA
jgi:methionyl-tRNA formyltransferase